MILRINYNFFLTKNKYFFLKIDVLFRRNSLSFHFRRDFEYKCMFKETFVSFRSLRHPIVNKKIKCLL